MNKKYEKLRKKVNSILKNNLRILTKTKNILQKKRKTCKISITNYLKVMENYLSNLKIPLSKIHIFNNFSLHIMTPIKFNYTNTELQPVLILQNIPQ